jgi:hypothetical protein
MSGKLLLKTRKMVEGTHKQHAWHDSWEDSIDIEFEGELTPEVCSRIKTAYSNRLSEQRRNRGPFQAALRTPQPDRIKGVDVATRKLILECSVMLSD